jgi:excisionase family DNA binding protein
MSKQASTWPHQADEVTVDDRYLSLRSLAAYAGVSVRTLRGLLVRRHGPLPHYRMGGKILVRRSDFDRWAAEFKVVRPNVDLEAVVRDVVRGLE